MTDKTFRVVTLNSDIERSQFDSASEALDRYFRTQVSQDMRRRVTACFVAVTDAGRVAGFYTLASTSVLLADLPSAIAKKLPRYPSVPAISMGRLAVDQYFKGKGLGGALLADALSRAVCAEIAAYALVVDAKDGIAACFYNHHGFVTLPSNPLKLFLPHATARSVIV